MEPSTRTLAPITSTNEAKASMSTASSTASTTSDSPSKSPLWRLPPDVLTNLQPSYWTRRSSHGPPDGGPAGAVPPAGFVLEEGDVLTVTRLDRLARSTRDLLNTLAAITGKKAGFKSLGDTWADTTTSHGRLMLTVLGGLSEFERELIRARTGEGRARAVARGQKMGRPFKLTDHQKREAVKRRDQGETLADIARSYNVSPATISRLAAL